MKFKVGDKVKFLNETGGGIVSEIIDDKMVNVKIEDGFEIPVLISELILDTNENKLFENSDEFNIKSENLSEIAPDDRLTASNKNMAENLAEGTLKSVYFGMVPVNGLMIYKSDICIYLINDCDFHIYYLIGYLERNSFNYLKSGMLDANTKEHIKTFTQTAISKIKKFHFQILFLSQGKYFPQVPVDKYFDISNISFYKESNYKENEFFHEKAVIFKIAGDNTEDEIEKLTDTEISQILVDKEGKSNNKINKVSEIQKSDTEEVDLHIHKITDDYSSLSDGEILNIQLNRFYSVLDDAVTKNIKKIVFIHGVGNGKLKYEIRKALDTKYPDLTYQDASFKEYGFGATLVKLK